VAEDSTNLAKIDQNIWLIRQQAIKFIYMKYILLDMVTGFMVFMSIWSHLEKSPALAVFGRYLVSKQPQNNAKIMPKCSYIKPLHSIGSPEKSDLMW